jgi:hypothetical protein
MTSQNFLHSRSASRSQLSIIEETNYLKEKLAELEEKFNAMYLDKERIE